VLRPCEPSIKTAWRGCIHQEEAPAPALVSQDKFDIELDVRPLQPPGPDDQKENAPPHT
jgi:hypothetical protein